MERPSPRKGGLDHCRPPLWHASLDLLKSSIDRADSWLSFDNVEGLILDKKGEYPWGMRFPKDQVVARTKDHPLSGLKDTGYGRAHTRADLKKRIFDVISLNSPSPLFQHDQNTQLPAEFAHKTWVQPWLWPNCESPGTWMHQHWPLSLRIVVFKFIIETCCELRLDGICGGRRTPQKGDEPHRTPWHRWHRANRRSLWTIRSVAIGKLGPMGEIFRGGLLVPSWTWLPILCWRICLTIARLQPRKRLDTGACNLQHSTSIGWGKLDLVYSEQGFA
jgi:hypothetical protein